MSELWTPSQIATELWLDAADAATITESSNAVSQWNDKSSNSRHVSQSTGGAQPTYSSADDSITFDGSDDRLVSTSPFMYAANGCNVFMVVAPVALIANSCLIAEGRSTTTVPFYSPMLMKGASTSTVTGYIRTDASSDIFSQGDGELASMWGAASKVMAHCADSGSSLVWRKNGGAASAPGAYTRSGSLTVDRITIGGQTHTTFSNAANIKLHEVLVVGSISDPDRLRIEGYFAHKWGLEADLPAAHPYKKHPPLADPYAQNVALLLPMNGADGSTTFTDASPGGHTVTASGNAQIDTAQNKFGGASALFDGTGDYMYAMGLVSDTEAALPATALYPPRFLIAKSGQAAQFNSAYSDFITNMTYLSPRNWLELDQPSVWQPSDKSFTIEFDIVFTDSIEYVPLISQWTFDYIKGRTPGVNSQACWQLGVKPFNNAQGGGFFYIQYQNTDSGGVDNIGTNGGFGFLNGALQARVRHRLKFVFHRDLPYVVGQNANYGRLVIYVNGNQKTSITIDNTRFTQAYGWPQTSSPLRIGNYYLGEPFEPSFDLWSRFDNASVFRGAAFLISNLRITESLRELPEHWETTLGTSYTVESAYPSLSEDPYSADIVSLDALDGLGDQVAGNRWLKKGIDSDDIYFRARTFWAVLGTPGDKLTFTVEGLDPDVPTTFEWRYRPTGQSVSNGNLQLLPNTSRQITVEVQPGLPSNSVGDDGLYVLTYDTYFVRATNAAGSTSYSIAVQDQNRNNLDIEEPDPDPDLDEPVLPDDPVNPDDPDDATDEEPPISDEPDQPDPPPVVNPPPFTGGGTGGAIPGNPDDEYNQPPIEDAPDYGDVDLDYTLRLGTYRAPFYKNGTVILSRPLKNGERIVIERKTPITNETNFSELQEPNWNTFEYQLDKLTMICQEIEGHICECLECIVPQISLGLQINRFSDALECEPPACDAFVEFNDGRGTMFGPVGTTRQSFFPLDTAYGSTYGGSMTGVGDGMRRISDFIDDCDDTVEFDVSIAQNMRHSAWEGISASDPARFAPKNFAFLYKFAEDVGTPYVQNQGTFRAINYYRLFVTYANGRTAFIPFSGFPSTLNHGYVIRNYTANIGGVTYDRLEINNWVTLSDRDGSGSFGGSNYSKQLIYDEPQGPRRILQDWVGFSVSIQQQHAIVRESPNKWIFRSGYYFVTEIMFRHPVTGEVTKRKIIDSITGINIGGTLNDRNIVGVSIAWQDPLSGQTDGTPTWFWDGTSNLHVVSRFLTNHNIPIDGELTTSGVLPSDTNTVIPVEAIYVPFLRNLGAYEVPEYCETLLGEEGLTVSPAVPGTSFELRTSDQITLTATPSAGTLPILYQWYKDDVPINGATSAVYEFTYSGPEDNGAYKVIASNSCGETSGLAVTTGESFIVIGG